MSSGNNTSLIALIDLYEQASFATLNLQRAITTAAQRIAEAKEEEAIRGRIEAEPDPDLYGVLKDALDILDATLSREECWKSAAMIPMLRILRGKILQTLKKNQAGGGSIQ